MPAMTRFSPTVARAQAQLAATKSRLARMRGNASGKGDLLVTGVGVIGGGALGGVIAAKFPTVAGFDTRILAGLALGALGAFAVKGKAGRGLMLAGTGVLADVTGDKVHDMLAPESDDDGGAE